MLNKKFNCNECVKRKVCKYKEVETPEIILKVEGKIDNEYCPSIIKFSVLCEEFVRIFDK